MKKEKVFTIQTAAGCRRLIALLFVIIFVSLAFARLITTDFGKIKNEQITIDTRGAQLNAELYYPVGASDEDSYPAVVLTHGGGVNYNCMRPMALELARRGFVVMNISFYGAGLSEMPTYDEAGQNMPVEYNEGSTPGGQIDAIRYIQTLSFVDKTRVGLAGHSAGGVRALATAKTDGIYFSLNDLYLNILYNEFGQEFTEDEIYQDAIELAKARLTEDQYKLFEVLAADEKEFFDTRVRTAVGIGSNSQVPLATVSVAGHDVTRSLKVNWFCCSGEYQKNASNNMASEDYMNGIYSSVPAEKTTFYILDDEAQASTIAGAFSTRSDALTEAADNRALRGTGFAVETHSQNYFSKTTNANIINIMETTLKNDSGKDPNSQIWMYRIIFTTISMLAMLALVFPVIGLLVKKKYFEPCIGAIQPKSSPKYNKVLYWVMGLVSVCAAMWAVYRAQLASPFLKFLPQLFQQYFISSIQARVYIHWVGLFAAITVVILVLVNKKKEGITGLAIVNNGIGVTGIFKNILMGAIYLAVVFTLSLVMNYLFHEEFRLWNVGFGLVNVEDWFSIFPYWLDIFLFYIVIGISVNYTVRSDIPEWKDTLITILINSLGVYVMFIISRLSNAFAFNGAQLLDFDTIYGLLLLVPVTTYISRKLYLLTKNIWSGAMINSCLIAWLFASGGYHSITYHAQNWISNFFGL